MIVKDAQDRPLHVTFGRERLRGVLAVDSIIRVQLNLTQLLELRGELDRVVDELVEVMSMPDPRSGPDGG